MEQFLEQWSQIREHFPLLIQICLNVCSAVGILIVGWVLAKWFQRRLNGSKLSRNRIDPTLRPVVASSIFYLIIAMTIYAFLTKLGVPAHSLLAVFGAAGLAIGLALKDTLSNIAAGVMLLVLRPLRVSEFVETPAFTGTVLEIGLFATTIRNIEGVMIFVPNSQVWAQRLMNYGRNEDRKFIEVIGVSYDTDLRKAQALLLKTMESAEGLITEPTGPECYVTGFGDSAINISCRCIIPPDVWLKRSSDLRIALKSALDDAGIEIPFPQRVLHMRDK